MNDHEIFEEGTAALANSSGDLGLYSVALGKILLSVPGIATEGISTSDNLSRAICEMPITKRGNGLYGTTFFFGGDSLSPEDVLEDVEALIDSGYFSEVRGGYRVNDHSKYASFVLSFLQPRGVC